MYFRLLVLIFMMTTSVVLGADKPLWINKPDIGCNNITELCGVGFGTSREDAVRKAKVELSKIFKTNISAIFSSNLVASNEDIQENIKEETDGVLEGVITRQFYESLDGYYVQVVLNKTQSADGLKIKITDLDNEIKAIYQGGDNNSKTKLKKLFIKRQAMNQSYLFLTGTEISSPIASNLIFSANKSAMKDFIIHINFEEKESKPFESEVIKSLTDMGYKISTGIVLDAPSTRLITGKLISEKQFINVKGFKKFKFTLKISVANNKKIETGHLNLESIAIGRTYNQAYEIAMKEILNELKEKINELNIE